MVCSDRGRVSFIAGAAICFIGVGCSPSTSSDDDTDGQAGASSGIHGATGGGGGGQKPDAGGSQGETGGSGSSEPTETSSGLYGDQHEGQFHLGPVDFAESQWPNACSPYPQQLWDATGLGGEYLAGVSGQLAQAGGICDSCIHVETGSGRSIVARVVTYGDTNEIGDIDVSPSVYGELNPEDAYPRPMTWQLAKCPESGNLRYQWQTEANVWWTSLWVRNSRVPLDKVEVKSTNHPSFVELRRASDGTLNDDSGFGEGSFTLRLTAVDGQLIIDSFDAFEPGSIIESGQQFE